jgi:hypothetical protein
MADLRQLLDSAAAREKLREFPGVERIGFGLKERAGQVLAECVFRVYVRLKKPLSELTSEEVIPAEIDGITTDVIVLHDAEPLCRTNLTPGKQITREVPNWFEGTGTLGCIVRKGSSTYILTNEHVIVPPSPSRSVDVYQPKRSTCAEVQCNSPVARVVSEESPWAINDVVEREGKKYKLDCGLMEIIDGVQRANTIADIGTLNAQIRDLASEPGMPGSPSGTVVPTASIALHKRGATTNVTHGTVVEFCHEVLRNGELIILWQLVIQPAAATTDYHYSETYRISADEPIPIGDIPGRFAGKRVTATRLSPGDASDRRIRFEGTVFSMKGDSGSICVDDAQRAGGLLFAGLGENLRVEGEPQPVFIPSGGTVACYIRPVFLALELDVTSAIVVASSPTSGPVIVRPGDALVTGNDVGSDLAEEMERFEAALRATTAGRHLLDLLREHHRELFDLVNRRRPVTVSWQRNKGPAFVAAFLNVVRSGEREIPKRVAGFSIEDLIRKMSAVLREEGSDRLRQAIEEEGELLSLIVNECETFDQVLDRLERGRFAGAQMQP